MRKYAVILFSMILVSTPTFAAKRKYVRVAYFKNIFGHIHQNTSKYSTSLSTLSCGHPVKIYKKQYKGGHSQIIFNEKWNMVKVGPYQGYIQAEFLSKTKVKCFQDKYPKFFDEMKLEISDMYYWGRLYDQYVTGNSKRPGYEK